MLVVTAVADGHVLDEINLVNGKLTYSTGASQPMVEAPRVFKPYTDAELYARAANSSNGYIKITEV